MEENQKIDTKLYREGITWQREIEKAEKYHEKFFKRGDKITEIYRKQECSLEDQKWAVEDEIFQLNEQLKTLAEKGYTPEYEKLMNKKLDLIDQNRELLNTNLDTLAYDKYKKTSGEAEARMVQKRLNYTPEQRASIYPLDDLDVPLDEILALYK